MKKMSKGIKIKKGGASKKIGGATTLFTGRAISGPGGKK